MSVKVDASGRRSVQSEAVVPGTPEQVWQAIATGPGVSSWFVPCTIDGRVGGEIVATFGPGMDSKSTLTAWDAPHSFSAQGSAISPGAPAMATVWTVEAQSGGSCVVRVVHSWFAETDEWDGQYESTELGWGAFFKDLVLYLANFDGQASSTFQLMGFSTESQDATWAKLSQSLGFVGKGVGEVTQATSGSPVLSGEVKYLGNEEHPEDVLLLSEPGPGIGHFFAMPMMGMVCLSIRVFLFGDDATETVSREESVWKAWLGTNFPMPGGSGR